MYESQTIALFVMMGFPFVLIHKYIKIQTCGQETKQV